MSFIRTSPGDIGAGSLDLSAYGPYNPFLRTYQLHVDALDPAQNRRLGYPLQLFLTLPDTSEVAEKPGRSPLLCLVNAFQTRADFYRYAILEVTSRRTSCRAWVSCGIPALQHATAHCFDIQNNRHRFQSPLQTFLLTLYPLRTHPGTMLTTSAPGASSSYSTTPQHSKLFRTRLSCSSCPPYLTGYSRHVATPRVLCSTLWTSAKWPWRATAEVPSCQRSTFATTMTSKRLTC